MGRWFRAMRSGVKGVVDAMGPGRYSAAGRDIRCSHCEGTSFEQREAQLNTTGMTMVGLDWLNRSGYALVCVECGLIQWFGLRPDRLDD